MNKNNTTKLMARIALYMTYTMLSAYVTDGYPWYIQLVGAVIALVFATGIIWALED